MLVNNRPYTNENGAFDIELITDLSKEEQEVVFDWIAKNIQPRKTENRRLSSYGLKHVLQRDTGIYITNNQFKDAMLLCGYTPVRVNELNWRYRISSKSKVFQPRYGRGAW